MPKRARPGRRKRPFCYKPRRQPADTWQTEEGHPSKKEENLQRRWWITRFQRNEIDPHDFAHA